MHWSPFYKYLEVVVGDTQAKSKELCTLIQTCRVRLRPLKTMIWNGSGVLKVVLRMMYIAYVRSVIDYAPPVLINLGQGRFRKLETVQNDAMRIILGCPKTAQVDNLRQELSLPSLKNRIREVNTIIAVKILREKNTFSLGRNSHAALRGAQGGRAAGRTSRSRTVKRSSSAA